MTSVRLHLDPPVQAAGEHHPTDLKTGSVGSKARDEQDEPGKNALALTEATEMQFGFARVRKQNGKAVKE